MSYRCLCRHAPQFQQSSTPDKYQRGHTDSLIILRTDERHPRFQQQNSNADSLNSPLSCPQSSSHATQKLQSLGHLGESLRKNRSPQKRARSHSASVPERRHSESEAELLGSVDPPRKQERLPSAQQRPLERKRDSHSTHTRRDWSASGSASRDRRSQARVLKDQDPKTRSSLPRPSSVETKHVSGARPPAYRSRDSGKRDDTPHSFTIQRRASGTRDLPEEQRQHPKREERPHRRKRSPSPERPMRTLWPLPSEEACAREMHNPAPPLEPRAETHGAREQRYSEASRLQPTKHDDSRERSNIARGRGYSLRGRGRGQQQVLEDRPSWQSSSYSAGRGRGRWGRGSPGFFRGPSSRDAYQYTGRGRGAQNFETRHQSPARHGPDQGSFFCRPFCLPIPNKPSRILQSAKFIANR